jgi:predicted phosphoribosyltransferase
MRIFRDRTEVGKELGRQLARKQFERPVVLALPRGGAPVAAEIARALDAPLDLLLVRKIGAPGRPELALGAVVEGDPPETIEELRADVDEIVCLQTPTPFRAIGLFYEDFGQLGDDEVIALLDAAARPPRRYV